MTTRRPATKAVLVEALHAVLLYGCGPWTAVSQAEWTRITGNPRATMGDLCNHIRKVLDQPLHGRGFAVKAEPRAIAVAGKPTQGRKG